MDDNSFTALLTPYLPLLGIIAGGILVGFFAIWNRKHGSVENRAPDVTAMWNETERSRRLFRQFQDLYYETRGAFRGYVRRVQSGGATEMTDAEKAVHDNDPKEES